SFGIANNKESITFIIGSNNYQNIDFSKIAYFSRATKGQQIFKNLNKKNIIRDIIKNKNTKFVVNTNNNQIIFVDFDKQNLTNNIIDDNFEKISKTPGFVFPLIDYKINKENDYFKVHSNHNEADKIIENAEKRINKIFETNEQKLKEIDDKKIDEVLKKLKI
ncbi:MAG: hypothetical protein IJ970_00710, partial [Mycoplasmataceae bacterium]|nr:hypothetical protein [Mycoplasmataceae bacterium]